MTKQTVLSDAFIKPSQDIIAYKIITPVHSLSNHVYYAVKSNHPMTTYGQALLMEYDQGCSHLVMQTLSWVSSLLVQVHTDYLGQTYYTPQVRPDWGSNS